LAQVKRILKVILSTLSIIYLLVGVILFIFQRDLIYFPTPQIDSSGKTTFDIKGTKINSSFIKRNSSKLIIYFGGNGEQIEDNLDFYSSSLKDKDLLFINYRGYGGSGGTPSKIEIEKDVLTIFDKVSSQYSHISIVGRSLGSGVASWVSSQRKVDKLVLITPYESIASVASERFPIYPMNLILTENWNSLEFSKSIKNPVLILIAENDAVIPPIHSHNLEQGFDPNQRTTITIPKAGHNNLQYNSIYSNSLIQFLQ
jgi:uncharacterized protein